MKKSLILIAAVAVLLSIAMGNTYIFAKNLEKNNPIEKAFKKDFENAMTTVEMNYVSEKYLEAWKAEMKNVAAKIKKNYKFKQDRKRVDEYVALYEKLGRKAFDLAMLNWSDISQPPGKRNFGTGGPSAGMGAEAHIYKQATLNLIRHYKGLGDPKKYKFLYKGKGAELDKVRKR